MKSVYGVVLAAALMAGTAAFAQSIAPNSGIQGDAPLDISSESFAYDGGACRVTYTGNVEMIQGQSRMRSPRVDAYYPRLAPAQAGGSARCGAEVERIEAAGPVFYVTPEQQARGNHGVFTAANDTIVLTGDVVLTQGQNVMTGARAVMNTRTRDARVESGANNGRVRSVLFPDRTQARPAQAAPARPAAQGR